jgi:hypothetical protein
MIIALQIVLLQGIVVDLGQQLADHRVGQLRRADEVALFLPDDYPLLEGVDVAEAPAWLLLGADDVVEELFGLFQGAP